VEIFIVFLLLLGAFNLGAVTADPDPGEAPTVEVGQTSPEVLVEATQPACRHDAGSVLQRDLTLPHTVHRARADGDSGHDHGCRAD